MQPNSFSRFIPNCFKSIQVSYRWLPCINSVVEFLSYVNNFVIIFEIAKHILSLMQTRKQILMTGNHQHLTRSQPSALVLLLVGLTLKPNT